MLKSRIDKLSFPHLYTQVWSANGEDLLKRVYPQSRSLEVDGPPYTHRVYVDGGFLEYAVFDVVAFLRDKKIKSLLNNNNGTL